MFINTESLKTWEEILEIALSGMTPEHRARLDAEARASGCSVHEVMEAHLAPLLDDDWEVRHPKFLARLDWARQPYGKDPLLQRSAP